MATEAFWKKDDIASRYTASPLQPQMLNPPAESVIAISNILSDTRKDLNVFDDCCGNGLVTSLLLAEGQLKDATILGGDIAPGMVKAYLDKAKESGWANTQARVIDCRVSLMLFRISGLKN